MPSNAPISGAVPDIADHSALPPAMPSDARLGVALIGAGNFARSLHLPNLVRMRRVRLRAICDQQAQVRASTGERWRPDYVCADLATVLGDAAVQAVVVAVRDDVQAGIAVRALDAGKHVYVEKPLAVAPEGFAPVLAALARSGRRLAVGFQRRFAPLCRRFRELALADGGARNIHIRMADDAWRWAHGYPPGHLIVHDVCHHFDFLRWLTGSEPVSAYCVAARPDDDSLILRFANGAVASVMNSGHGTLDMPKERIEAITTRGGVTGEDFVELTAYGYPGVPYRQTFAGHSQPDRDYLTTQLYRHLGITGMAAVRRMAWEMRQEHESGRSADRPDAAEIAQFVATTIPNFTRDQGWFECLEAFLHGIITGRATDHATASDAARAGRIAAAVVQSRDTGAVVQIG